MQEGGDRRSFGNANDFHELFVRPTVDNNCDGNILYYIIINVRYNQKTKYRKIINIFHKRRWLCCAYYYLDIIYTELTRVRIIIIVILIAMSIILCYTIYDSGHRRRRHCCTCTFY